MMTKYEERNRKIFEERLIGKTLEELGQKYFVTRERIRQIEWSELKKSLMRNKL